ncbi:NAD(P)/FAD-dependent oxidoreductase [Pendulispora albinea]|uniref:NAD(P)/FAD-dependent oxidoreductase n=1 Tax=Pendulispora albinea TaxID=2741071 RepID=A0ABZ2LU38_9BACT
MEFDVAIVGGGPAGSTTAIALAKAAPGRTIVLLEKATYPREKYCAGALGGRGEKILAELDASPKVPSVPLEGISFRGLGGERKESVGSIGRVVRRAEFDHALANIAASRGVTVAEGARVEAIDVEPAGSGDISRARARVTTSRGEYRARVVVGADGVGSTVRKAMGHGAGRLRAQVLEVDTEPVPDDRARSMLHFDLTDHSFSGYFWDFPTLVDGRALHCRGIYRILLNNEPVDLEHRLRERLAHMGLDLSRYKQKRFAERGYEPDLPLATNHLMLVGEAAGIDPVTGEGIAQAIEYGALAGPFLADVLAGRAVLPSWSDVVRRSRLGWDLRKRTRMLPHFFGELRAVSERFLVGSGGSPLRTGIRHFAGHRQSAADMAVSVMGAGAHYMAMRLGERSRPAIPAGDRD